MKLSLITLYVQDMEKSLDFYTNVLGLNIVGQQKDGRGRTLVFLGEKGEANLELISSDTPVNYSGFSIGFSVAELSEIKERLRVGGIAIKQEMKVSPTTTLCFFDGPNGEELELVETK